MRTFLFSDLDNTLLQKIDQDYIIIEPAIASIKQFIADGNLFAMASGRNCADVYDVLAHHGINLKYVIGNNGACIIKDRQVIQSDNISLDIVLEFIKIAEARGYYMTISDGFKVYIDKKFEASRKDSHPAFKANTFVESLTEQAKLCERIVTIGFTASKDDTFSQKEKETIAVNLAKEFEAKFADEIQILWSSSKHDYFDLVSRTCDKGKAIMHVLELEEGNFDEVAGIGDALNDIEMLKIVDKPIMMRYGHDKLKKYTIKEVDVVSDAISFINETK